ncbi:MAG TPA: hypothetical protein VGD80_44465 [Kofleriaceae bacterium]
MTLASDLLSRLNISGQIGTFSTALDTHSGSGDDGVGGLSISVPTDALTQAGEHADGIDLSSLGPQVTALAQRIEPLIARLPGVGDTIAPILTALDGFESVMTGDLPADLSTAIGSIEQELRGTGDGFPALLLRIVDLLRTNPTAAAVGQLTDAVLRLAGAQTPTGLIAPVRDVIAAIDGALRVTGGLMSLETVLSDAERVTGLAAQQLDRDALERLIARTAAAFGARGELTAFVRAVGDDDSPELDAAVAAVAHARRTLGILIDSLAGGLGLGEATLIYVDVPALQGQVDRGLAFIRAAELAPTRRAVTAVMDALAPYLAAIDPSRAPDITLDALLTQVEGLVGSAAAGITSIDTAGAVRPVADVLGRIADVTRTVAEALEGVVAAVRGALAEVRGVIAALPFDDIANAIRTALAPITAAFDFLRGVIGTIGSTLHDTAEEAKRVLALIEKTVDDAQREIDEFFGHAKTFIDGLHLDQVIGQVSDNLRAFAELIGRARMAPYFDTAVDVIGTTADVVGAIPFSLLPDSMEAEVNNAVKPIRDVDIDGFETQIKSILQITPDGKFALRGDIQHALDDLQKKYDEVLKVIVDHHPRLYLHDLDLKLVDLSDQISKLSPQIGLEPLAEAIDKVKSAVTEFDLSAQLEPVRAVFRRIDEIIDQYNPAALLHPIEERLDQARAMLVDKLALDRWVPTLTDLRDQAFAKLDALDPVHQTDRLTALLETGRRALDALPGGSVLDPLGSLVCMGLAGSDLRLSPDSFATVRPWLTGEATASADLTAHCTAIGAAIDAIRAAVDAIDVGALGTRLARTVRDLRDAIAAHPDGSAARVRLELAATGMDVEAPFVSLAANRTRYQALLASSADAVETLRRAGFSNADDGATGLRAAFTPTRPLSELGHKILAKVGLRDLDRGFRGVALDVFDQIRPARVAGLLTPIFTAVRDRLRLLIDTLLAPIIDAADQLKRSVDAIDLTPVVESLQGIVDETKHQIDALSPDVLLAGPLGSFTALQDALRDFDPLSEVIDLLEQVRDTAARLVDKLHAERILKVPLEIVDDLLAQLQQLSFDHLLTPVFDALDGLAGEVSTGLDETVEAFKRLQQALPSGSGTSGSLTVSGSVG